MVAFCVETGFSKDAGVETATHFEGKVSEEVGGSQEMVENQS